MTGVFAVPVPVRIDWRPHRVTSTTFLSAGPIHEFRAAPEK